MTTHVVRVTTTGSAGSASGTATTDLPVRGLVMAIKVDYHASAPATTTVNVDETSGMQRRLLQKAASNSDAVHYPVVQNHDPAGAAITGQYMPQYVNGVRLSVSVGNCNALTDAVVVTIDIMEG